ncbi:MAG: dihydropteroate synthase [Oleiphilus sp.]|nr:MAG: dihydropteroate synthase [Oleiphilus sp.]
MGVLNVTPDSFSDGGRFRDLDNAIGHAGQMISEGASLIDIGGESTRPGAAPVSVQEELDRVCPVVERLVSEFDALVSVDTSTPEVMREAIRLGCSLVNDVRAFSRPGAIDAVRDANVALCVMHMQGEPDSMQQAPRYDAVVDDLKAFFAERIDVLSTSGVCTDRLILDPGFGFGKTLEHNLLLLRNLRDFQAFGLPVLVGMSRKSMIGAILGNEVDQRLFGSLSAAVIAAMQGAWIIRAHDVLATVEAIRIVDAVISEPASGE